MKSKIKPSMAKQLQGTGGKYGPTETENVRVGTIDAESEEARRDDHGMAAVRKRRRGGKVEGKAPRMRLDRARRHPDEKEDEALIRKMVKPADLKPHRASGGAVKGKKGTNINIIIGGPKMPGSGGPTPPMGGAPMAPPSPTMVRPPAPAPVMAGGMPAGGMPPGQMPPQGMPMRKRGGSVYPIKDGAGSGPGREEKVAAYGKRAKEVEGR